MSELLPPGLDSTSLRAGVAAVLATAMPHWLPEQRWFADKGRQIQQVELSDLLIQAGAPDSLMLAVVTVEFAEGTTARYLLPLAITANAVPASVIAPALFISDSHVLVDGLAAPQFGAWLLDLWAGRIAPSSGAWQFSAATEGSQFFERARHSPGLPMGAEQSNTSLRFDQALIVKLFRRLQSGPNPDEEILRALGERTFPGVPTFAGSAFWRTEDGNYFPIALGQAFVANQGDGWAWMLQRLRRLASSPAPQNFDAEWLLGQRTAQLHLALSAIDRPDFNPEPADSRSIEADMHRLRNAGEQVIALLRERASSLPAKVQGRLPALLATLHQSTASADGFRAEAGLPRIRVHGDFHLGQTLRTPDHNWIIIDFEGEPARPVPERRQRASVLKDVAGMLRSFSYARGVVEREHDVAAPDVSRRLRAWELGARQALLSGYREAVQIASPSLVAADSEAFARALAAWELEKVLYEIEYEVRNRPSWVEIPLAAVLPEIDDHTSEATGAAPAYP